MAFVETTPMDPVDQRDVNGQIKRRIEGFTMDFGQAADGNEHPLALVNMEGYSLLSCWQECALGDDGDLFFYAAWSANEAGADLAALDQLASMAIANGAKSNRTVCSDPGAAPTYGAKPCPPYVLVTIAMDTAATEGTEVVRLVKSTC